MLIKMYNVRSIMIKCIYTKLNDLYFMSYNVRLWYRCYLILNIFFYFKPFHTDLFVVWLIECVSHNRFLHSIFISILFCCPILFIYKIFIKPLVDIFKRLFKVELNDGILLKWSYPYFLSTICTQKSRNLLKWWFPLQRSVR